jgi:hypothetical protein
MSQRREPNGKYALLDHVVTVSVEHYVTVRAHDAEQAAERAVAVIANRYGRGHNPHATSVEQAS